MIVTEQRSAHQRAAVQIKFSEPNRDPDPMILPFPEERITKRLVEMTVEAQGV